MLFVKHTLKYIDKFYFVKLLMIIYLLLLFRYNIDWFMASLRVQKLILFLLQKGSTDLKLNIGGLFIPALESFAMVEENRIY